MRSIVIISILLTLRHLLQAQPPDCILKPPQTTVDFGSGMIRDVNATEPSNYLRVGSSCPTDGHYSFAPYTIGCFRDDWHSLSEDHTPGDKDGNMLLVNAAPRGGRFLDTRITGLKSNTRYEVALWLINLCRPTKKCPTLLLPSLNFRLEAPDGKIIAIIVTKDIPRIDEPEWTQHRAYFTTPASTTELQLVMTDNAPGGCGNDFALDDITFRECVKQVPKTTASVKTTPPAKKATSSKPSTSKTPASKTTVKKPVTIAKKKAQPPQEVKISRDTGSKKIAVVKPLPHQFAPAPMILKTRENELAKKIETEAGTIKINLYDNGEIDGDTVSIYHNNTLIRSRQRLSQKPITITLNVTDSEPHHELIMVAENLGSIPPNTSVMIITTPANRYEVFISSSDKKNAKVVFDLKK